MRYLLCAIGLCLVTILCGCKPEPTDPNNPCGKSMRVYDKKVLGPGDFFSLHSTDAKNDCEATYTFYVRWHDPGKQVIDNDMPPLQGLDHAFTPLGTLSYFPHPAPIHLADIHEWEISFSIGDKNGPDPTQYSVITRLDPNLAGQLDSTEVECFIDYYPYQ